MCYWPSHSHALVSPRQTLQQYKVNVTSYFGSLNPHAANEIYLIRVKIRLKLAEWQNLCLRKSFAKSLGTGVVVRNALMFWFQTQHECPAVFYTLAILHICVIPRSLGKNAHRL